jgi:hypothetical protein
VRKPLPGVLAPLKTEAKRSWVCLNLHLTRKGGCDKQVYREERDHSKGQGDFEDSREMRVDYDCGPLHD